ncbi:MULTISPECIES: DEAD/DEAH box helicase family protein [unclassified Mycoplasma]|uniref:DEAD/DEAH box helicase family protein n=1 Tax=unclassified Mycoplasma TaxID=2683645 RepID=UPI00211C9094|nr:MULTISPECIES: DEAD/DEAH box helicase family protein [unclassified Mycoplasma]UUM20031.1 DEAD/DEAH box helicase family protein [Mycoplasma sp. 1578d]UUM25012.1 DEAD/DEAH box helicase family protein [Mycoplasma sp. 3686d]
MKLELSEVQKEAVDKIFNFWQKRLDEQYEDEEYKKISFKAPTGSGKTFMIANVIDQMIEAHKDTGEKLLFLIATISSAELPKQFAYKLNEYKSSLWNNNMKIQHIESPSNQNNKAKKDRSNNILYEKYDVMIVGKSSFGKGTIFYQEDVINRMIDSIKNDDNIKLIYIRDEAHIGADERNNKDQDLANFENLVNNAAFFSIHMTATPIKTDKVVEITELSLYNDKEMQLLKKQALFNEKIGGGYTLDDVDILKAACQQFKEIKKEYGNTKKYKELLGINPAMLIQIRSKSNGKDKKEDLELEQNVEKYKRIVEEFGLSWATYFDYSKTSSSIHEKIDLKNLSANSSAIDVIFFKVGPATGWDIPRACMLVQLRKVSSDILNIQTIGRIKRNPIPKTKLHDEHIANKYFLYSNYSKTNIDELAIWKIRDDIKKLNYKIPYGKIEVQVLTKAFDKEKYLQKVSNIIKFNETKIYLEKYEEEYRRNGFLIGESRNYKNSANENKIYITSHLYNKIDLRLFINKQRVINKKYFSEIEKECLKNLYNQFAPKIQKAHFTLELFEYIVYKEFLPLIIGEYKKIAKKVISQTDSNSFVLDWAEISETFEQKFNLETDEKLFIFGKGTEKTKQRFPYMINENDQLKLDSEPEKEFMRVLKETLENNRTLRELITLWTRNKVYNGFSYGYLENNDDINVKKSYPDLLLIVKENHMLFVEVKSEKDIDPQKTNQLLSAYEKYVHKFKEKEQDKKVKSLTMLIYKPKENTNYAYIEGYSSINKLNQFLKKLMTEPEPTQLNYVIDLIIDPK